MGIRGMVRAVNKWWLQWARIKSGRRPLNKTLKVLFGLEDSIFNRRFGSRDS